MQWSPSAMQWRPYASLREGAPASSVRLFRLHAVLAALGCLLLVWSGAVFLGPARVADGA